MGRNDESSGRLGIIGGSGLYELPALAAGTWKRVDSAFGEASDEVLFAEVEGREVAFIPRHGRGHRISPSEINYRANIDVMKQLGVTDLISISAVGSLREDLMPGDFVLVDQFIDRTYARKPSFFDEGVVGHVSMAEPTCARLRENIRGLASGAGVHCKSKATYVVIEGPQFSTRAESEMFRQWGADVVGMTNYPEARLARESEICFATVAMVTDYDCWHPDHDHVDVQAVLKVLASNKKQAEKLCSGLIEGLDLRETAPASAPTSTPQCGCATALDNAILTAADKIDQRSKEALRHVAGRVL